MFPRACVVAVVSLAVGVPAAQGKMFVSSSVGADGAGHVEGYAVDLSLATPATINDNLTLDVQRGGVSAGSASGVGYAALPSLALVAGDVVTLTDVDTTEGHSFAYTGAPALALDGLCGGKFTGVRDEGASVSVSAGSSGGGAVAGAVVASGPGTSFAGGFTTPLSGGWTLKASQTVAADPAFTVFADVSAAVTDCPPAVVAPAAPAPVVTPAPAPAPAPAAPAPAPAVARDLVAPTGTLKLKTLNAYRALLGGTFADAVTTTEPGTVAQTLYAGRVVVATGRAKLARAGSAKVVVKLTRSGRSHLRSHRATPLRLVTTLTDTSGNARVLTPKHFTIRRGH
ncbi:hypothetical protein [Conexibacter woesei]|uniref:hypothetical protein n=1 Tax=Conexibacter woesei TaxID=191495 RepID=UPI0018CAF0ED|nr:hypothetical protein [Conexibacter woesei]